MSKPKVKVCRICLRSDLESREVDEIINDFYEELCEYDINEDQSLKYCTICEYQLRKCYNFKQKCLRASTVLKSWKKKKKTISRNLHKLLPPSTLGFCTPSAKYQITDYKYLDDGPIPVRSEDSKSEPEPLFDQRFLFEHSDANDSDDAQENIPLSNIQVANMNHIDVKEIDLGLKIEIPDSDTNALVMDSDYMDSEHGELDRYINSTRTEEKKPSRTKDKDKVKMKTEPKSNKSESKIIKNSKSNIESADEDTSPQANKKYLNIKEKVIEILDNGEIHDLGDNSKITSEIFAKIYDKFLLSDMRMLSLKKDSQGQYHKLKKALLHLLKKYNPDYETVFDIEYLDTEERKLNEFNRRKVSKSYMDATFQCELCYRGFEKQTQFEYHNKWHTPSAGEFLCGICGMRFQSLKTRASHRASSHSAVYSCKMCPLVTYHYPVMLNHYEQHKGVEYSCPTCLSVFENKTTFMNHQRDHNADKKKSICTTCAATFISDVGLMLHRKSKHTEDAPTNPGAHSTCQLCKVTFDCAEVYMKHVALAHTKKAESFRCAYCHIRFGTLEELRTHKVEQGHQRASKKYAQRSQRSNDPNPVKKIKINTPDKPFVKCELCPAMVSTAFTSCMYKHFLKDHPDIPYSSVYSQTARRLLCDLCGKTFMDPAFFADHANMHSGLKPYLCTQCPARFATRRHLGLHTQRHGPARHVCNHCGKRFHSAANLFNHRKTHIGDRRFKCEICFKGFLHAATLNEHVRGVHHHIRKQKPHRDGKNSYRDSIC